MNEQQSLPATQGIALVAEHSRSLPAKTVIFLLKKKSFEMKVTLKEEKFVSVKVFNCKDVNLSLATTIARTQEQLIRAEAYRYRESNFPAYLLTVLDSQGWIIQSSTTPDRQKTISCPGAALPCPAFVPCLTNFPQLGELRKGQCVPAQFHG